MSTVESQIRTLLNNVADPQQLVFVVGAGVSVASGHRLWGPATELALRKAKDKGLGEGASAYAAEKFAASDYYEVFEILGKELPDPTYYEIAQDVFSGSNEANEIHRQLVRCRPRGIITTNFDQCLPSACVIERGSLPVTDLAQATAGDQFFVVNPHGSILAPRSMVLRTSDWNRVEANIEFRELLSQLVSSAQFVFVGYSMRDPDFNRLWEGMLQTRIFRSPAIYLAVEGSIPPARRQEMKEKRVQVIEFPDRGNFAFLSEVLSALAVHEPDPSRLTGANLGNIPSDLEQYVLLCMQFSPERISRLVLVTKALSLEYLATSRDMPIKRCEILAHVTESLGQESRAIQDATDAAIADLAAAGVIRLAGESIHFEKSRFEDLSRRAIGLEKAEETWIRQTLADQSEKLGMRFEVGDQVHVSLLLDKVLLELGREVAELLLFNRLPKGESERIEAIVRAFRTEKELSAEREQLYQKCLKRLVFEPGDNHEEALFRKLQAYFISSAYVLSPTSEKLLADYARNHWVYLDSSIILPALAIGHPAHAVSKRLLQSSRRMGMKLKVLDDMVNEVWANVRTAIKACDEFAESGLSLTDILEGYVTLHGHNNGNVFLEGLSHQLRMDPSLTARSYMASVLGTGSRSITEGDVIAIMAERLDIECDVPQAGELDPQKLNSVIGSIEHLRKMGNRYKNRLLCEHEARQFLLIHERRKQNPSLAMKIWFVTTDYFITELQRLERDKYPLPISYTPRTWFQYLDLIDFENRGSRHFSKLQPKMRFGVVSGELGIEGIRTILKERRDLISKGVVSVRELAEAAVKEHHVRNSIAEYDRAAGSSRVEGSRKAVAKTRIQNDIRAAVDQFVAVRKHELQRIEEEKSAAINEAARLKKRLAKSDYLIRTLRNQALPAKGRRRSR